MEGYPPAIEQIHDQLMQVFGSTNPNQFFTMLMPGTLLNAQDFLHDTRKEKPARVARAESELADQMFDLAKVSGSSNGQHVSAQYLQALSCLVPKFDRLMPEMKTRLREFVTTPARPDAQVDGQPFAGTLAQHFFAMYRHWLALKSAWEARHLERREKLGPDDFLVWYETHAETELAKIDAAYGELVSTFPPADMEAILGALDSGPSGEVDLAQRIVQDVRMPSPSGGYVYPVEFQPSDWFSLLGSEIDPRELLPDPAFIASTLTVKRRALHNGLQQVESLLARMPRQAAMDAAVQDFHSKKKDFTAAETALSSAYVDNTLTAVEIVAKRMGGQLPGAKQLPDIARIAEGVAGAKREDAAPAADRNRAGRLLDEEDLKAIVGGQKTMLDAQDHLLDSLQSLSAAASSLQGVKAEIQEQLPGLVSSLQSQLDEVKALQSQLDQAAAGVGPAAPARIVTLDADAIDALVNPALTAASPSAIEQNFQVAPGQLNAREAGALLPLVEPLLLDTLLRRLRHLQAPPDVAAATWKAVCEWVAAAPSVNQWKTALQATLQPVTGHKPVDDLLQNDEAEVSQLLQELRKALADAQPLPGQRTLIEQVLAAAAGAPQQARQFHKDWVAPVWGRANQALKGLGATLDPDAALSASERDPLTSAIQASAQALKSGHGLPQHAPRQSGYCSRFMTLRLAFSRSDMQEDEQRQSGSTTTTHNGGFLFFGGGGTSTNSFATSVHHAISSDVAIEIEFQAAKVEVQREWLDPGVFKLTDEMHRLVNARTTYGDEKEEPPRFGDKWHPAWLAWANKGLLPCIPVAFVVVKDVKIRFHATSSGLDTIRQLVDSSAASGGGFFCFRSAASSQSHGEASGMHSRVESEVVSITMPAPQILGWFLELLPADESTLFTDLDGRTNEQGKISVTEFVRQMSQWRSSIQQDKPPAPEGAKTALKPLPAAH